VEAPPIFEEAVELEHPIVLLEPLAFLLNRLLEQICARLGSRALSTQELRLTLEPGKFLAVNPSAISHQIRPHPASAPSHARRQSFLKLLQLDLNAHPPGAPIMKIHLAAEPARPRSAQGGLFQPPSPEPEKLELTLARIAGMVGENKVGALELLDTHHPEGFRMRRFMAAKLHKKMSKKKLPAPQKKIGRDSSAPLPSSAARPGDAGKRPACIFGVSEKRCPGRRALASRPLALFRRLVGTRSLVARRVGPCFTKRQNNLFLPPGARPARRRLVRGRHV
jgi:hypothetical protein